MNDIPAFPHTWLDPQLRSSVVAKGMTLRDYFAAKAMQGFLTGDYDLYAHEVVQRAYEMADAMMKARET
jgi:hypothetical protein